MWTTIALGLALSLLTVFAVVHCLGTPLTRWARAGWVAAIVLLPGLGVLAWALYYTMTYRLELA